MTHILRRAKVLVGAAAIAASMIIGTLSAREAFARGYMICRVDPTVLLSNGTTVTMYADVQDSAADIKSVTYTLHGPRGTVVLSIGHDAFAVLEKVTYTADRPANVYMVGTTVTTGAARIKLTAFTTASENGAVCTHTLQSGGISNVTSWVGFHC